MLFCPGGISNTVLYYNRTKQKHIYDSQKVHIIREINGGNPGREGSSTRRTVPYLQVLFMYGWLLSWLVGWLVCR